MTHDSNKHMHTQKQEGQRDGEWGRDTADLLVCCWKQSAVKMIHLFPAFKVRSLVKEQQPADRPARQTNLCTHTLHHFMHELTPSYASSNSHKCICTNTHNQQEQREKWVRLTSSVSLHLRHTRGPTISHWILYMQTHTWCIRAIVG